MQGLRELVSYWNIVINNLEDRYEHEQSKMYRKYGKLDAYEAAEEEISRYEWLNEYEIEDDLRLGY